jgi:hypothetical protein
MEVASLRSRAKMRTKEGGNKKAAHVISRRGCDYTKEDATDYRRGCDCVSLLTSNIPRNHAAFTVELRKVAAPIA